MTEEVVRVANSGPVSTVFLHRPARRNAVDGPTAAQFAATGLGGERGRIRRRTACVPSTDHL